MESACTDRLIEEIRGCVKRHNMGQTGQYARWLWQNEKGDRKLGCNPYGCADAANILDSISDFPRDEEERRGFVGTIRGMQDKVALEQYAERYLEMMREIDYERDEWFNDLHMLFGAVCCLAELQMALPGKLLTSKPLRLVLDRRPFI